MKLLYDKNDLPHAKKLGDSRFLWLEDLGATELAEAALGDAGFLFGYEQGDERLHATFLRNGLTRVIHVLGSPSC